MTKMKIIIHSTLITILLLFVGCNKNKSVKQEFYPSGKLKYEALMADDLRNGTETEYYENGSIKMQGNCVDGLKVDFYYYYDVNQQLDSIIEYIPVNSEEYIKSFLDENNNYDKDGSWVNRKVIFKNGDVDREKSIFFEVYFKKDTVLLGDTIFGSVDFVNQSHNQKNKFEVFIKENETTILGHFFSKEYDPVAFFIFVPETKGKQILKGLIKEKFNTTDGIKLLFFEKEYYVK